MSSEKAAPPPAYVASTTPAHYWGQYGGDYNTQYGQQLNVPVVQQPGVMVLQRNIEAGEKYNGLFIGSILVTILCCWPIGICAIVSARKAQTAAIMGRVVEAENHASSSKGLNIAAIFCGIILMGIIVALKVIQAQQTRV